MKCLLVFVLILDIAMTDTKKRLVLHSDLDIDQAFHDLRQEIDATKQENTALKTQMEQLNQTFTAKLNQETEVLQTKITQEKQAVMTQMTQENLALKAEMAQLTSGQGQGSTYVRWGRTVCGGNGTQKVYSGYTAGSYYNSHGGAASYICLPETPSWAYYVDGNQDEGAKVYGAEYQTSSFDQQAFKVVHNEDPPCVVCHSSRAATIMIPGSTGCYSGWTQEYTGYLMSDYANHVAASDYACVDKDPEIVFHGEANTDGKLLYFTEVQCGGLPCHDYPQGRELACVVCSK